MQQIGFSHGDLYRVLDKYSPENFKTIADSGSEIIEICWNSISELDRIMEATPFVKTYPRTSIHLPTDVRYSNDEVTRSVLEKAFELYQAIGAELVVAHPDLIDRTDVFDRYPISWAAENMDCRKKTFRGVEDMKSFFQAHDSWGMVLDVNHCFSNDPSMKLADEFIATFHERIQEIHLSGYAGYHEPLYQTKQEIILAAAKKLDVPIIIESTFDAADEVKKEFEYVTDFLRKKI